MAAVLGFLAAMGPLCTDLYLPALPGMAAELSSSASQMQLSITACLLGLSLGQIVLGPLSDARGRKLPLLFSLVVFILASFLCSRASGVGELVALRFIQGLAGSGGDAVKNAARAAAAADKDQARILLSSLLSACVTAFAGPVSFVGTAVPQIVKSLFHTARPILMVPACFLGGAVFCLFCDLLARTLFSPTELSISTVTAVFGAPVVIVILLRSKKEGA